MVASASSAAFVADAGVPPGVVLGVDFGGSKIAVALAALDGTLLTDGTLATEPQLGAAANVERAVRLARQLLAETASLANPVPGDRGPLLSVGACTFGIPQDSGVALSPAVPGWDALPLRRHLEAAFRVPVSVMTDVKAAASAEARHGVLRGADPGLYLNLGTGLAVAFVLGGKVVRGAHGAAGEIGYNLRSPADVWDRQGAGVLVLEDVVSGMGLSASVARLDRGRTVAGAAGAGRGTDLPVSASEVFERAGDDPAVKKLLDQFLRELCYHLVNLTIALDPERIAVGGGMVRSWDVLREPIRSALRAHVPYPPEVLPGAFPYDAALHGAIDLGLELALGAGGQRTPRQRSAITRQGEAK